MSPTRDGGKVEADGYLVNFVVRNGDAGRSKVCVFDARDLSRGPVVCRLTLPQRVPNGLHTTWVRGERLKRAR